MTERTCFDCFNFRTILPLKSSNGSKRFTDKKLVYSQVKTAWCRIGYLTGQKKYGKTEEDRIIKSPLRKGGVSHLKILREAASSCPEYDG